MRHVNARDVLPDEVLKLVRRYCTGYVYVPSTGEHRRRRREEVVRLKRAGLCVRAIAERVDVTERRVRQILAEKERRK
jgi:hypothetical protein